MSAPPPSSAIASPPPPSNNTTTSPPPLPPSLGAPDPSPSPPASPPPPVMPPPSPSPPVTPPDSPPPPPPPPPTSPPPPAATPPPPQSPPPPPDAPMLPTVASPPPPPPSSSRSPPKTPSRSPPKTPSKRVRPVLPPTPSLFPPATPPPPPMSPSPSPPSPVTPVLPPTPSPPSPVNPLPPTPSPPSPANPIPPTPTPSPPSPPPPPPPSQAPAAAPAPTTTPPPPAGSPSPAAAPMPSPSPPSPDFVFTPSPPGDVIIPSPPYYTMPSSPLRPRSSPPPPPSWPPQGTVIAIVAAVVTVIVIGLVSGLCYFCSRRRHRRRRRSSPATSPGNFLPVTSDNKQPQIQIYTYTPPPQSASTISDPPPPPQPSPAPVSGGTVSYADLEAATDGFSEHHLLGQGGFGHVYRGVLHGGRKEVAIKKLRPGSGQGDREFRAEVDIISRVHHCNLVSLVGFCIHGDHRLLVYEFVPNKTLDFHLHESGRMTLDWPRRWKIAVRSAKGLAYLHEDCRPKIIHRDIKAANILLDYSFEPKVADFGLAKIQPGDKTHVSTRVIGTFGYVAPEYAHTGKVNDRSDVYSFGVVLLELITGRRPLMSTEPYNDETLVSWARPLLTKALEEHVYDELVDPKLDTFYDAHDMHRLITIAAAAVRQTARSRPRMSQIVRYMEGELSIEDLNAGVAPGQSSLHSQEHSGDTTEQIRQMRRLAFVPGTGSGVTGAVSDSGYLSELTSEYGLNPSSSSSDGDATSRPHAAAASNPDDTAEAASRHSAAAKPMSRRTHHGRAGRLP